MIRRERLWIGALGLALGCDVVPEAEAADTDDTADASTGEAGHRDSGDGEESSSDGEDAETSGGSAEPPPLPPDVGEVRWLPDEPLTLDLNLGETTEGRLLLDPGQWTGEVSLDAVATSAELSAHFEDEAGAPISTVKLEAGVTTQLSLVVESVAYQDGERWIVPTPTLDDSVRITAVASGVQTSVDVAVTAGPLYYLHLAENHEAPDAPLFGHLEFEMAVGTVMMIENPGSSHTIHSDQTNGYQYPHMGPGLGTDFKDGMGWNPTSNELYAPGVTDGAMAFTHTSVEETYCHDHGETGHEGQRIKLFIVDRP